MPRRITQCYLPPGRGDIPALTPAEAGTRFSDPGGCKAELTGSRSTCIPVLLCFLFALYSTHVSPLTSFMLRMTAVTILVTSAQRRVYVQGGPKKWGRGLMTIIVSNLNRIKNSLENSSVNL